MSLKIEIIKGGEEDRGEEEQEEEELSKYDAIRGINRKENPELYRLNDLCLRNGGTPR